MTRPYEWVLSGLHLTEPDDLPASGFWFKHYGEGWDFGEPSASNRVRPTLALDGDDVVTERWGNREIVFTVAICARSIEDIHDGERELAQRIGVPGVLEYLPPESGPRTLYRVRTSSMAALFDDLDLIQAGVKYVAYRVTLNCEPWAYPETVITETFTPGTPTITVGDACTANTNWPGATAVTHLGQSAVRTGPVTATPVSGTGHYSSNGQWYGVQYGAAAQQQFTGTVAAANYMYIDFVGALSGLGDVAPPYLLSGGQQVAPLASQLQSDGFTRYFWARLPGPLTFYFQAFGMASGDTASFYVDEFGTSTSIPSGGLLTLTTLGSVRTEARLQVTRTGSSSGLGETLVYADPSMLSHGWQPDLYASLASAPDGTYYVYAQPTTAYAVGDVFSLTVASQTVTTRAEHDNTSQHWIPFGPFQLGGNKSRRLGTISGITNSGTDPRVALLKNGSGTGYTSVSARLIREDEDAALVHAWLGSGAAHNSLFIEPASIDVPEPGIFAGAATTGVGATSVLSLVKTWGWPRLVPPTTALWIQSGLATGLSVTVTHRPPFHTLSAEY